MISRDKNLLAGYSTAVEILLHMSAAIYFVGFSAQFQVMYIVVVSIVFTIDPDRRRHAIPLIPIVPAVWIGMLFFMSNRQPVYELDIQILTILHSINALGIVIYTVSLMGFVVLLAATALKSAWIERRRADRLLLNILPVPIAGRLKVDESTIADGFIEASIFFCDIVDFTVMSSGKPPEEVVEILNELFSRIDGLLDEYAMEKIKTIGDAYMAVCGVPEPVEDHADKTVSFAEAV